MAHGWGALASGTQLLDGPATGSGALVAHNKALVVHYKALVCSKCLRIDMRHLDMCQAGPHTILCNKIDYSLSIAVCVFL